MKESSAWSTILKESMRGNSLTSKNIIVFGDKNSGKKTLMDALKEFSQTVYPIKSDLQINQKEVSLSQYLLKNYQIQQSTICTSELRI